MPDHFTRRRLAKLAAVPLLATAHAPAQEREAPTDDLATQRANLNRWREQMKQVKLPRELEPAVTFKA